jgi:hypothetical protein
LRDNKGGKMREQNPTEGWQERLRTALEDGPRSMSGRALSRELEELKRKEADYAHLRGISASGVHHYLTAENFYDPRRDTLTAMARVLRVRPEWLLCDDGPMTEDELRQQEQAEWKRLEKERIIAVATGEGTIKLGDRFRISGGGPLSVYALSARITDALKIPKRDIPPLWIWSLIEVGTRMGDPAEIETAFDRIGDALATLADAFGIAPADMTDLDGFMFSMVPGLMALAREARRQKGDADG